MYRMEDDIAEVFISEAEIQDRVRELGAMVSRDYAGRLPVLVGVLRGVLIFMADLLRALDIPVAVAVIAMCRSGPTATSGCGGARVARCRASSRWTWVRRRTGGSPGR